MTLAGKLIALFPAVHLALMTMATLWLMASPSLIQLVVLLSVVYLVPLLAFHVHQRIVPMTEGTHSIVGAYSPWFGTHMLQQTFMTFTSLEGALRLVPGLYPLWLRAWGSRVGRGVYFAPHVEVADRSLLDIGDGVVFGYGVKVASHYISPSRAHGGMKIYIRRVTFEDGCFIGAACQIAPGAVVRQGALVKSTVSVYPDEIVEKKVRSQTTAPTDETSSDA